MEEKREEILSNLVEDKIRILEVNKSNLEKQITENTAQETELQDAYLEQRKEKLAETIVELKILNDEKEKRNTPS